MIQVPTNQAASRGFCARLADERNGASRRWGVRQFAYDENGSMLREYDQAAGTTTYYAYADNGLASRMKPPTGSSTYFHYDARMQRFAIDFGVTLAYFGWDGLNQLEERKSDLSLETQHTHGATPIEGIGSMVVTKHVYTPDRFEYPHYDHRGSLFFLEDTGFGYLDTEYNAFGEELYRFGDAFARFGYQGPSWMRCDSGLYVSPTRLYVPGVGRFGQEDLHGDWLNRYAYARSDPVLVLDGDGKEPWPSKEEIEHTKKVLKERAQGKSWVKSLEGFVDVDRQVKANLPPGFGKTIYRGDWKDFTGDRSKACGAALWLSVIDHGWITKPGVKATTWFLGGDSGQDARGIRRCCKCCLYRQFVRGKDRIGTTKANRDEAGWMYDVVAGGGRKLRTKGQNLIEEQMTSPAFYVSSYKGCFQRNNDYPGGYTLPSGFRGYARWIDIRMDFLYVIYDQCQNTIVDQLAYYLRIQGDRQRGGAGLHRYFGHRHPDDFAF